MFTDPHAKQYPGSPLGSPAGGIWEAMNKLPGQRTPAERFAIKERVKSEQRALEAGQPVKDGIYQTHLDEEKSQREAKRNAFAATAFEETRGAAMGQRGFDAQGRPLGTAAGTQQQPGQSPAGAPRAAPANQPGTSGGYATRTMPDGTTRTIQSQPLGQPTGVGFAMRTLPDGSVRGATMGPPDAKGNRETQFATFESEDKARAFYANGGRADTPSTPAATPAAPLPAASQPSSSPVAASTPVASTRMDPNSQAFQAARALNHVVNPASTLGGSPTPSAPSPVMSQPSASPSMSGTQAAPLSSAAAQPPPTPAIFKDGGYVKNPLAPAPDAPSAFYQTQALQMPKPDQPTMFDGSATPAPSQPAGQASGGDSGFLTSSTSQFASPTTRLNQTAKKLGTPSRAGEGTDQFFASIDD